MASSDVKLTTYSNRSVLTGASLLRIVASLPGAATLQEIAEASGMLTARTHRYLLSLVEAGLLEYDRELGRYDLGALVIDLGLTALGRIDAVRAGSDALARFSGETGLLSLLTVWGSNGPTIVKCQRGRFADATHIREGLNLPLLTSATGRIFLAYMPPADTHEFLMRELAMAREGRPKTVVMTPEQIEEMRQDVRRQRLARNLGITAHDALAAPVFNHEGKLAMVMATRTAIDTSDMSLAGPVAAVLTRAAAELSERLGAREAPGQPARS